MREDGRTNGRTDGKIMYSVLAHPYHAGSHEASLVKFCTVIWKEIA